MCQYPTSHNYCYYQSVYLNWHLSWSIQKLFLTSKYLDKDDLIDCRLTFHSCQNLLKEYSYLRLADYSCANNLLKSFQSAYQISFYWNYSFFGALSHQQVTNCLTLLDLSAAFDTIDHSILFDRLWSWFDFSFIVPSWIKSYLLNRSFYMSIFKTLNNLPSNVILSPVDSARNIGVISDKNLSFAQHISAISKSCFHNIRDNTTTPLLLLSFITLLSLNHDFLFFVISHHTPSHSMILLIKPLSVLLFPTLFVLKLTIATLFSISLPFELIVFNSSTILLLVLPLTL